MIAKLRKNKFFKNSILYTLGSMMTPLVGFIMLPVYTNYLTPTEYGIMTTVSVVVGLLHLLLLLSLHSAVMRFYYDFMDEPDKQREYLGSIYLFVFIFSSVFSGILLLFSETIGSLLFSEIPIKPYFYYIVGLAWASSIFALPTALLRAQEKAGTFILINIIKTILTVGLTIYFLIYKGMGAQSALLSQFSILIIITFIIIVVQLRELKLSFNLSYIKVSLLFSLPLLPHVASTWIISSSDRVILEKFIPTDELGIYALAVQIASVLSMFYTSINSALVPRYTKLRKEGKEQPARKLLKVFMFIVVSFGILAIPIAIIATRLVTSVEYHSAVNFIPILLIGQIINGFYLVAVAKLFYVKKTNLIAISSLTAALFNIIINLVFIPIIGIWGAVLSTIFSEVVRFLFIYKASKKIKNY